MKRSLLFLILTLWGVTLMAHPVDQRLAVRVAQNFVAQRVKAADTASAAVVYTHVSPKSGEAAIYAVNVGGAFVLVSADDVAHPVLGYSFSRPWPAAPKRAGSYLPSQVSGYLDDLANQIAAAVQQSVSADAEIVGEWQELTTLGAPLAPKDVPDSVGPLLTTTWDQGQYYNAMCPEDDNGPDGHVYAGCVATAMAQIINYWGYPVHGRGTHSYDSDYGTLEINYSNVNYDFANMPESLSDTSTDVQIQAVAQLMYHCGVATNMEYGDEGSGSSDIDARAAFINFFRFSPDLSYADRNYFSEDEWYSLLNDNISNNQPIMYSGHGTGGHAFVCDGYKSDNYYHFNFGWNGNADGWYLTSAISPGSMEFNSSQSMLVGIFPDSTGNIVLCQIGGVNTFFVDAPLELYHTLGHNAYTGTSFYGSIMHDIILNPINNSNQLLIKVLSYEGQEMQILNGERDEDLYEGIYEKPEPIVAWHGFVLWCQGLLKYQGYRLRISQVYIASDTIEVCDRYSRNGILYTESQTFVDTVVSASGCDSILTHRVIVNHSSKGVDVVSAYDSITWNNITYYESGIYDAQNTLTNTKGCDSTVSLWLTIIKTETDSLVMTDTVSLSDTVCTTATHSNKTFGIRIYTEGNRIVVDGALNQNTLLYDENGVVLATKQSNSLPVYFEVSSEGTYFVKVGDNPAIAISVN